MSEPYIFFEDVPDAAGVLRHLQTTKMTFNDAQGRLCLLGMCVDVTEMTRAKSAEAEARVKQQELDEKLALHERLIEQEYARAEELKELATYTKTKKYAEEVAKDKLGLVYENEIIFKETN